jgi:hypothetical protein
MTSIDSYFEQVRRIGDELKRAKAALDRQAAARIKSLSDGFSVEAPAVDEPATIERKQRKPRQPKQVTAAPYSNTLASMRSNGSSEAPSTA